MKIAIASGKGGTGKTTLATNLASYLAEKQKVVLTDMDVEEPNSSLFIKGNLVRHEVKYRIFHTSYIFDGEKIPLDDILDKVVAQIPTITKLKRDYQGILKTNKDDPTTINTLFEFRWGEENQVRKAGLTLTYELQHIGQIDVLAISNNNAAINGLTMTTDNMLQTFNIYEKDNFRMVFQNLNKVQLDYNFRKFLVDKYLPLLQDD